MNKKQLFYLDEMVRRIKAKGDSLGYNAADTFIILTMEIMRLEIASESILTKETIAAFREIASSTSHFYYSQDHPELYEFIQAVYLEISKLDPLFYSADLEPIGFERSDWQDYLRSATANLLSRLTTSSISQKQDLGGK